MNSRDFARAHNDYLTQPDPDEFSVGDTVNVTRNLGDAFTHDFTGHIRKVGKTTYIVEDQDGNCWEVDPDQIEYSSDDIMHND